MGKAATFSGGTMIVTTTDLVPGREIVAVLGLVIGAVPYFGSTYAEGIKDLHGRTSPNVPDMLERRRKEAVTRMIEQCPKQATAVIGMAFDIREITGTWREVCAYGTAVVLSPL
jgi:uncharacterized protein YbjQ (UPF0145 family)